METNFKKGAISQIQPILIEDELKTSFLDYAMSVVVSRAIPDIRDGLKPVHRRILYTMSQLGFYHNKPYHKSVRVVGEVLGKYHPHGDQALYQAMVGMVQDFSKRYPILDGQGNWGSVDGDNAAAMRYTEVRMQKIAQEILADLYKDTVEWVPNFDESTTEPVILPSRIPNYLVNGTSGIAVGMATSVPPHNLGEVLDACLLTLEDENVSDQELFEKVKGPDFPTGGIICGRSGIYQAYRTGRGGITVRAVVNIEETKKNSSIVVTELPYQVNKSELIIKIADLVKSKTIEGISNIRDESDKRGIRLVIDVKRNEDPHVVLNQLYKFTSLQTSFNILMLGLLNNQPSIFTLRHLILEFLQHRKVIIYRRTEFELRKAKAREHILEGFIVALNNIDKVVALIKSSNSTVQAQEVLQKEFNLSEVQVKAILEMKLQRLTALEQEKIFEEIKSLKEHIKFLSSILMNPELLKEEVAKELEQIKNDYADERRTKIESAVDILSEADLIPNEEVVVTLTAKGYTKRVPLTTYEVQHRGGKGKKGMNDLGESEDALLDIFVAKNHDDLLFFTNLGRVYSLSVFQIPEGSRTSKGRAVVNLLPLSPGEKVVKLLCTRALEDSYLIMVTKKGTIKRTKASMFAKIRKTGIRAITLSDTDQLAFCSLSCGTNSVVIATKNGQGIRFLETEVRSMGRQASGVIGIRLKKGDEVVGMEVLSEDKDLLFATSKGYGKRVKVADFRIAHRGGSGVRTIPTGKRNGYLIGFVVVDGTTDVLLIDNNGKIIRLSSQEIRCMGRQAKGVRLIKLEEGRELAGIAAINKDESCPSPGLDCDGNSDNNSLDDLECPADYEYMDNNIDDNTEEII